MKEGEARNMAYQQQQQRSMGLHREKGMVRLVLRRRRGGAPRVAYNTSRRGRRRSVTSSSLKQPLWHQANAFLVLRGAGDSVLVK